MDTFIVDDPRPSTQRLDPRARMPVLPLMARRLLARGQ